MADVTISGLNPASPSKNTAVIPFSDGATTYKTSITGLSASITPVSTNSRILISMQLCYAAYGSTQGGYFKRNNVAICLGNAGQNQQRVTIGLPYSSDTNQMMTVPLMCMDNNPVAGTNTYQFFAINDNGYNLHINRATNDTNSATGKRGISTVTLMEIAG